MPSTYPAEPAYVYIGRYRCSLGPGPNFEGLALSRRPHLWVHGVDELLEMLAMGSWLARGRDAST